MSRRPLTVMERLRAESMNTSQPNRQLIVDAFEEIRMLNDECIKAHARSVEARLKWEGRWMRLKDASIRAVEMLTECRDHYDMGTSRGDAQEMWGKVTNACNIMYECMNVDGIGSEPQRRDSDIPQDSQDEKPPV